MMEEDVRWLQRLDSFRKACRRVLEITESDKEPDDLSELEQGRTCSAFRVYV